MADQGPKSPNDEVLRRKALSRWENEGGAVPTDSAPAVFPALTNAELVQLRIRVIALENLVIALMADATEPQLERVRDMASFISPRPGATHHPWTVQAASQMTSLVERARYFRDGKR